jgi:Domain of Unknown Function (DUF928)
MATLPSHKGIPALILLAPNNQPGQTTSTRPTFAWFVRDAEAVPLEFRLYEQDNQDFKLIHEIKGDRLQSNPGIMVLDANASMPELAVGRRYRWQVELVCNANRPAGNPFAEAELEVVPLQSSLKSRLQQTRDRVDRAQLYDQANLWYDLLHSALVPSSSLEAIKALQSSLFNRVTLNSIERNVLQNSAIRPVQP